MKNNIWKHSIKKNKPYDYSMENCNMEILFESSVINQFHSSRLLLFYQLPTLCLKKQHNNELLKEHNILLKKHMGTYTQYTYHRWIIAPLWVSSSMLTVSSPRSPSKPGWVAMFSPSPPGWPAVCSPLLQQGDWHALFTKLWSWNDEVAECFTLHLFVQEISQFGFILVQNCPIKSCITQTFHSLKDHHGILLPRV